MSWLVPVAVVVLTLGIGWSIEPSGIQAADGIGPDIVMREPPISPTRESRRLESAPAEHAIVVDRDLDLDLDFATMPSR